MPPQNLKVDTYKYQFLKKKWPIHIPIGTNFPPNFEQNHPIFPKFFLSSNLGKFWNIDPFIYQILHFIKCHLYTKRLILLPMLAAHPRRIFYTEYPPDIFLESLWIFDPCVTPKVILEMPQYVAYLEKNIACDLIKLNSKSHSFTFFAVDMLSCPTKRSYCT